MKKLVPYLVIIWLLIGAGSFFVWWKVTRNLTTEEVTIRANKVAQELEIPWALRFKKIKPAYAVDFRVVIEGLEAVAADGTTIFSAQSAEVRMPWTAFFSQNPVRVNVAIDDVAVTDWNRVLKEIEVFLDERRTDSSQQVTLPKQFVESTFNLRLNRLRGPWGGKEFGLDKLYLLNVDPNKPTAFEIVFPWEYQWRSARLNGETKILGEYRFSRQKVDLHYYLKNRVQLSHGSRVRSGDFSVEGKGFFHPRMGLFSTMSAKDDWIALVGDVEWSEKAFKMSVPKFALSHELILDLLPFTNLHNGTGVYQSAALIGEFRLNRSAVEKTLVASVRTKGQPKITTAAGIDQTVQMQLTIKDNDSAEASVTLSQVPMFTFTHTKKEAVVEWNPSLFLALPEGASWYAPHNEVWDLIMLLPWSKLTAKTTDSLAYQLERSGEKIKVSQFSANSDMPLMNLIYPHLAEGEIEWSTQFDSKALEGLFQKTGTEFPLVPGHAYTGSILAKSAQKFAMKLAWKGGVLPLLARSSCKGMMQDRPELKSLFDGNFAHQAEVNVEIPTYKIVKWTAKSPAQQWELSGEWSNSPIKCQLKIQQRDGKKKPITHLVEMN